MSVALRYTENKKVSELLMDTKIKICGIRDENEAIYLNNARVDYAGMVMFYPKSKRNVTVDKARDIMKVLDKNIKRVAVTVSPSLDEVYEIDCAGFDYIQIHGNIPEGYFERFNLPVIKAFNVKDIDDYKSYAKEAGIAGFVFDSVNAGSGKTFDWSILKNIPRKDKLFILAGGIDADNVSEAIKNVKPDVIDVSSGVELEDGSGKSESKIYEFVRQVRKCGNYEE